MPSLLQSAYRNQQDDEYDSSEYCTATSDEESEDEVSVINGIQFVKVLVQNILVAWVALFLRIFKLMKNHIWRI